MDILTIFVSAIFVNNILLSQFLGNCPYLGCSREKGVAVGMGAAVIFVTVVATLFTWLMQHYVLDPLKLGYLQTIVFIVVIAALVQFVEMFLKKMVPPLYRSLGIYLPLITTNCAVMGVALLMQRKGNGSINFVSHIYNLTIYNLQLITSGCYHASWRAEHRAW